MVNCWLEDSCKHIHCNDPNGCMIKFKLDYLYSEANVPPALRKKTILRPDADNTDLDEFLFLKEIQGKILEFVQGGKQLLIHSNTCGNGKTAWSIKLLQAFFNKIWLNTDLRCRALFISVPQYLIGIKDNLSSKSEYIEHIKENALTCDLIIWDDIGTKAVTTFEQENLFSIIDARIAAGKANIFTSNLLDKELHEALGDRLASRICNIGYNIVFNGGDKRHIATIESANR